MQIFNFYRSRKLVLVGYDFHSEGGAWRSIYRYFRHAEAKEESVLLIDRRKQGTFRQLISAILFSSKILFNGMEPFYRWEGLLACLWRKDILVYLHDTEFMVEGYARQHPWKFRLFRLILRRNRLLCVSRQMEEYYRTKFGSQHCHIVREAVKLPASPDFEPNLQHIVMVGSIDERKGVPLFTEVAALAAARKLPWKFHWIGALASQSLGKLSPDVRWWGWQDSPVEFVRRADAFFLSSVDDPLPLACLEAMTLGKRCVVYRRTGMAEMIEDIRGCAVFENYSAEAALVLLEKVLGETPDVARLTRTAETEASVPAFAAKIEQIIG
jgi:glycosyltransferase involved in cell wall biosynthesis